MSDPNAIDTREPRAAVGGNPPLILAGASCRAVAQCAERAGYAPVVFDDFQDRDLREIASCFPLSELPLHAEAIAQGGSPSWGLAAGGIENRPDVLEALASAGCQVGLDRTMLTRLRDARQWQRWASESQLRFPATRWPEHGPPPERGDSNAAGDRGWLVKSLQRAGGLGVLPWDPRGGQPELCPGVSIWQERLVGVSVGVSFLATSRANHFLGAAGAWDRPWPWSPTAFLYRGNVAPLEVAPEVCLRLEDFGERVRRETGLRGLWGADWIVNADGWWLLEINPRWSASMELLDAGSPIPWVELHVRAIQDDRFDPGWLHPSRLASSSGLPRRVRAKGIVYANMDWSISEADLAWMWERRWRFSGPEGPDGSGFADIPSTAERLAQGTPVLSCLAQSTDVDSMERAIEMRVRELLSRMKV